MQVEISEQEARALCETLERVLSDLSVEIADTDRKEFREGLKSHRDLLKSVAEKVKPATV